MLLHLQPYSWNCGNESHSSDYEYVCNYIVIQREQLASRIVSVSKTVSIGTRHGKDQLGVWIKY